MRRTDDVFFFTLIDFLVQVLFFGLLLFVVAKVKEQAAEMKLAKESAEVEKIKKATGISDLTELTDTLTRLAPITELKGTADFIRSVGGIEKVKEGLDRLHKYDEGSGKPPCLFIVTDGKRTARS